MRGQAGEGSRCPRTPGQRAGRVSARAVRSTGEPGGPLMVSGPRRRPAWTTLPRVVNISLSLLQSLLLPHWPNPTGSSLLKLLAGAEHGRGAEGVLDRQVENSCPREPFSPGQRKETPGTSLLY